MGSEACRKAARNYGIIDSNMDGAIRLYHGSKGGLQGAIRPVSDAASDFGSGFYMGDEMTQPQTLICDDPNPVLYTLDFDSAHVLRLCV